MSLRQKKIKSLFLVTGRKGNFFFFFFFFLRNLWKVHHFQKNFRTSCRRHAKVRRQHAGRPVGRQYADKMRIFPCEHFFISNKKLRKEGDQKQRFFFFLPYIHMTSRKYFLLFYSSKYSNTHQETTLNSVTAQTNDQFSWIHILA